MKRLEVTVIVSQSEKVEAVFYHERLLYSYSTVKARDEECKVYWALTPDQLVDKTIETISERLELRRRENTIAVFPVEGVVFTHLDRLKEKVVREKTTLKPLGEAGRNHRTVYQVKWKSSAYGPFCHIDRSCRTVPEQHRHSNRGYVVIPSVGTYQRFRSECQSREALRSQLSILVLLSSVIALSFVVSSTALRLVRLPVTSQILSRSHASIVDVGIAFIQGCAGR